MEETKRFGSWNDLMMAIPEYEKLGYECEVRGWEAMSNNILTIRRIVREKANERQRTASRG